MSKIAAEFRRFGLGLSLLSALALSGCGSHGFLYYNVPHQDMIQSNHTITEIGTARVDIIWQVGGMTELKSTLNSGAQRFITQLIGLPNVDWKVGVIPNQTGIDPLLGFDVPFDVTNTQPVQTFTAAVAKSVDNYDGEKEMDPIHDALVANPSFSRKNATLVVIMTNDNHDESAMAAADFLSFLTSIKGDLSQVVSYAVLGATDLGCDPATIDEDWNYHGSSFEQVVTATHGQAYSLCTSDFGTSLANIMTDLVSRVTHPRIYLDYRPVTNTIQVVYNGHVLPGGPVEKGGYWYYDFSLNALVFYNLKFALNATTNQRVQVTYARAH